MMFVFPGVKNVQDVLDWRRFDCLNDLLFKGSALFERRLIQFFHCTHEMVEGRAFTRRLFEGLTHQGFIHWVLVHRLCGLYRYANKIKTEPRGSVFILRLAFLSTYAGKVF